MSKKAKILLWDIETGFMTGFFHQLWHDMVPYSAVISHKYLICASWKFLGDKKVNSVSVIDDKKRFKKDPTDDYYVVKALHALLSDVDAIIHHNGDKFDIKVFNARAIYHGFKPLPEIKQIDTLKIARKKFKFESNRLDDLGDYLKVGRKIKTSAQMWIDCFRGVSSAVKEMVKYNKQDVLLLEDVYLKIAPWVTAQLNQNLFDGLGCPLCGSEHKQKQGTRKTHKTRVNEYQRYQCQECGHWYTSRNALKIEKPEFK